LHNAGSINFTLNQQGGTLQPGASPGTTNILGDYNMSPAAIYEVELLDLSGAGIGNDLVAVSGINGIANLDGTLDVLDIGYVGTEALGDTFVILTATGGVNGTFASASLPALGGGLSLQVLYGPNDVRLTVVPEPSTLALCGVGLAGLAFAWFRRRRRLA
jgi:hypothetical protein